MNDIERDDSQNLNDSSPPREGESSLFPRGFEKHFEQFYQEKIAGINPETFWTDLPKLLKDDSGLSEILKLGLESIRDQFEPHHASGDMPDTQNPFDRADASVGEEEGLKRIEEWQMELGKTQISERVHREHEAAHNTAIADFFRIDMLPYLLKFVPKENLYPQEILRRGYRAQFAKLLASGATMESLFPALEVPEEEETPEETYSEEPAIEPYDISKELSPKDRKDIASRLEGACREYLAGDALSFKAFPVQIPVLAKLFAPDAFAKVAQDPRFSGELKAKLEDALRNSLERNDFENALAAATNLLLLYPNEYARKPLAVHEALGRFNTVDEMLATEFDSKLEKEEFGFAFQALLFSKFFSDSEVSEARFDAATGVLKAFIKNLKKTVANDYIPTAKENLSHLRHLLYASLLTGDVVVHPDRFEFIAPEDRQKWS